MFGAPLTIYFYSLAVIGRHVPRFTMFGGLMTNCLYSLAVIDRRVPRFTVFGGPMTNCFLLMDECPPDQIILAGDTKNILPQVRQFY
jgi:hypothetical protein